MTEVTWVKRDRTGKLEMELTEPKPKKFCRLPENLSLPVILKKDGTIKKINATFSGFSVIVNKEEDMKTLISMGYFGKANFSRSYPQFTKQDQVKIIRSRQFKNRKQCFNKFSNKPKPAKVITVPDSSSDDEDYFINLVPKYELDYSELLENVWLSLEEAFFLAAAVKCLLINYKGTVMDIDTIWDKFTIAQPSFIRNYIAYFYFRAKNWVVKPGIKFGGDFLLYKQGPPFYHASYVVVIEVLNSNSESTSLLTNSSMNNVSILGLNRLCETAGKELLICKINWPQNGEIYYGNFNNIEVQEILVKRWMSTQERQDS